MKKVVEHCSALIMLAVMVGAIVFYMNDCYFPPLDENVQKSINEFNHRCADIDVLYMSSARRDKATIILKTKPSDCENYLELRNDVDIVR